MSEKIDITLPGRTVEAGGPHPVSRALDRILAIFNQCGLCSRNRSRSRETTTTTSRALNFPEHHPARAMHDYLLPAQRTSVAHPYLAGSDSNHERDEPTGAGSFAPGRVFRSDSDQTHTPQFHQVEGLLVDEGVTFADLKGSAGSLRQRLFPEDELGSSPAAIVFPRLPSHRLKSMCAGAIRMAAPGAELEVLGFAAWLHPNVLTHCGIDPERYTGYAFGLGVERFAMLRYRVNDLRLFFENDLNFLRQFR